jgi:hypothetical protein
MNHKSPEVLTQRQSLRLLSLAAILLLIGSLGIAAVRSENLGAVTARLAEVISGKTTSTLREQKSAVSARPSAKLSVTTPVLFAQPAADLEQARNGRPTSPESPVDFQTGNLGAENSHYSEGQSAAYRAVLTNLPLNTPITLTLGYDIKHTDKHAIDYLTYFDRLQPHFGHTQEVVNPLDGVAGTFGGPSYFAIPAPGTTGTPVAGQPLVSFNALPANDKRMTIWNGAITAIAYNTEGDLALAQSETTINVTFTATSETVVLAWGGHIASRLDWGFETDGVTPRSAGGISGSPYHMRLKNWTLGNLENLDRSLSAEAVCTASNSR